MSDEPRFEAKSTAESHFAWLRTRLSLERTMMSWVRTSVALIGFGFTIVQFFQRFHDMEGVAPARRPQAPWYLGLALIAAGICALGVSTIQYRALRGYLRSKPFANVAGVGKDPTGTPLLPVAIALIAIGIFAFLAVLTRAV